MTHLVRNGVKLFYKDCGDPRRECYVFVHGWGGDMSIFAAQQQALAENRRTITVDLRGHGQSDAPEADYTLPVFRDDLVWLCQNLGIPKAIFVGHSMGGAVALELAAAHPALARAAVLVDTVLFPPEALRAALQRTFEGLLSSDYRIHVRSILEGLFTESEDTAKREPLLASAMSTPRHVLASAFVHHLTEYDPTSAAASCCVPIAYIKSEFPLSNTNKLQSLISNFKLGQTLGAGHFSPVLAADQITAMLRDFERTI